MPEEAVARAPRGRDRLKWLGPGFLWMVSAAGSGELLFTPRVGSLYGYALIWAVLAAVVLKWVINREIGRNTVCTGRRLLDGFSDMSGRSQWAVWVILVPQTLVAVATIAGMAGAGATAVLLVAPGPLTLWTTVLILLSSLLVLLGRYKGVEIAATALGIALALAAVTAAIFVGPDYRAMGPGFVPTVPPGVDHAEVLPWLGFMLSGAAGLVWYSYWLHAKGYGGRGPRDPKTSTDKEVGELRRWVRQMTLDNTVAVVGVVLITLAFLVLGTELLRPQGLVPEENQVAPILGRLLGDVFGPVGFWFMVLALLVGFWTTVLSDQDGWGRMFSNGTSRLLRRTPYTGRWLDEKRLLRVYVVLLVTAFPILLFALVGEPVTILKLAGAIEAIHIPIVGALVLYLNHRQLPKSLRPNPVTLGLAYAAILFFGIFASLYILQQLGITG